MKKTEKLIGRVDKSLGRLLLRSCAVLAFIGAALSTLFGAYVLYNGYFQGLIILMLGAFLLWLGLRAWSDRATLGEVLNRDFENTPTNKAKSKIRGSSH